MDPSYCYTKHVDVMDDPLALNPNTPQNILQPPIGQGPKLQAQFYLRFYERPYYVYKKRTLNLQISRGIFIRKR